MAVLRSKHLSALINHNITFAAIIWWLFCTLTFCTFCLSLRDLLPQGTTLVPHVRPLHFVCLALGWWHGCHLTCCRDQSITAPGKAGEVRGQWPNGYTDHGHRRPEAAGLCACSSGLHHSGPSGNGAFNLPIYPWYVRPPRTVVTSRNVDFPLCSTKTVAFILFVPQYQSLFCLS